MTILRTVAELREWRGTGPLGFVPTMGALHEGHLSLVRHAAREAERTLVSIFVNPTQFGPTEDLAKYPRPFEQDVELAEGAGAGAVFAPTFEELYPSRGHTKIVVRGPAERYEGMRRPGHFEGVCTVVAKLLCAATPTVSVFGLKDLQQCAVVGRLHRDLFLPGELLFAPTCREPDGLAMSSRNRYLQPEDRAGAALLSQMLFSDCEPDEAVHELQENGFAVEYYERVRLSDFSPAPDADEDAAIVAAARYRGVRLIDNLLIGRPLSLGRIANG